MDEPLANLDPHLRATMEEELAAFHRNSAATTLYITHDQHEAMALAGRIAVMWDGRILQSGPPEEVYARPATARVAGFIGKGALLPVEVLSVVGGRARIRLGGTAASVACPDGTSPGPAQLLLRPEQVVAGDDGIPARIVSRTFRGNHWDAVALLDGVAQPVPVSLTDRPEPGDTLRLNIRDGWILPEV